MVGSPDFTTDGKNSQEGMGVFGLANEQVVDVSVIIPVYNDERFVAECVDSVRRQKDVALEIICIDDGSTDGSAEVIRARQAEDPRIRLLVQENAGPGPARNRGMEVARGRYVAFLDSDDFYLGEDALAKMVRFADAHGLKMTGSKFYISDNGAVSWRKNHYGVLGLHYDGRIYDYRRDLQKVIVGFTGFVISLAMLRKYDIQFPHFLRNEDPVFIVKALFHAGKVAFIDADLYVIRNYPREDRNANDCAITAIVSGCREIVEFAARHDLLKVFCHELDVIEYNYPNIILKFFNNQMMSDLVEINHVATSYAGMKKLSILARIESAVHAACQNPNAFSERIEKLVSSRQQFYLYGAGRITQYILACLKMRNSLRRIKAILVSEAEDNPAEMDGVPVFVFEAAKNLSRDDPVVIAVGHHFIREIEEKLMQAGMKNIIVLSDVDRKMLRERFMKIEM